jgi:hypothetical protein
MGKGVVDHQAIDVAVGDAGLGAEKQGDAVDAPVYLILGVTATVSRSGGCITLSGVILIQRAIHYPSGDFCRRHEFELTVAGESLSTTGRALLHIAIRCVILTW